MSGKLPAKRKPGRPSSFDPDELPRVTKLGLLGASNEMMAQVFDVDVSTIERWIKNNDEFRGALQAGRIDADGNVAKSLYDSALGGVRTVDQVVTLKTRHADGSVDERAEIIEINQYVPANVTAQIFFLKNRQRTLWRDVRSNELSGPDGRPIELEHIPTKTLDQGEREKLRRFLEAKVVDVVVEDGEAAVETEEDEDGDDDGGESRT